MSYILDALKKAQAERELGQVPKVQDLGALPQAEPPPAAASGRRLVWIGGAIGVACGVTLAAFWILRASLPAAPAPAAAAVSGSSFAPATTAAGPASMPPTTAGVVAVLPPTLPPRLPPSAPAGVAMPALPPPATAATAATASAPAPGALTGATMPSARPAEPAETVIALEALDPGLRARLPPLAAGGAIHSAQREQRMVILDGQVLREGDALGPDVRVLSIEPQGVVLALGERLGNRRVRLRP